MQSPVSDGEDPDSIIREALATYKPGSTRNLQGHGFSTVCLQLFGFEGDGKSSLINSCLCVVRNLPFSNDAGSGTSAEAFTTTRREYKLTDTVRIADNRGLKAVTPDARLELAAQLRNLRSPSTVDWEFELERTVNQLEERCSRNSMDFMVPVLVYSLDSARLKNVADEFGPLLRDAFEITGIFPIVVLTRYTCSGSHVNNARKSLEDLGSQHVVLLDNYTTTNSARRPDTDSTVLKFLHLCLQEADRGIQRRQSLNVQCGLLKQAAEQIRAEMRRQKEKEREERGRQQAAMEEAEDRARKKEAEISHKEGEIASLNNQIQSLNFRLTPNTSGGSLFGQTATFGAR